MRAPLRPSVGQLGVPQHQSPYAPSHPAGVGAGVASGGHSPLTRAANSSSITEEFTIKVIAGLLCASVFMVLLMIVVLVVARYRLRHSERVAKGILNFTRFH